MTLHLRSIRNATHDRSDVRVVRRVFAQTTEALRDEVEAERPSLRWPLRKPVKVEEAA